MPDILSNATRGPQEKSEIDAALNRIRSAPASSEIDSALSKIRAAASGPGSSPENRLQEMGISQPERTVAKAMGSSPENVVKFLRAKPGEGNKPTGTMKWYDPMNIPQSLDQAWNFLSGAPLTERTPLFEPDAFKQYDAELNSKGQIAVRPKGSSEPWKVVDPDTGFFSKDFLRDVGDVLPEAAMALSPAKRAVSIGGTMALGELGRRSLGEQYGVPDTPEEAQKAAITEGLVGAGGAKALELAAPVVKRTLQGVGGLLRLPEKGLEKVTGEAEQKAVAQARRDLRVETDPAFTRATTARKALRIAKLRAEDEATAEAEAAQAAGPEARRAAVRGRTLTEEIAQETAQAPRGSAQAAREGPIITPPPAAEPEGLVGFAGKPAVKAAEEAGRPRLSLPPSLIDPVGSFSAKTLRRVPRVAQILREVFGNEFVPEAGSFSMKHRGAQVTAMLQDIPAAELERRQTEFLRRAAELVLTADDAKLLEPEVKAALKRTMQGSTAPADQAAVSQVLEAHISRKQVPDYLKAAIREKKVADIGADTAREQIRKATEGFNKRLADLGPDRGFSLLYRSNAMKPVRRVAEGIAEPLDIAGRGLQGLAGLPDAALRALELRYPGIVEQIRRAAPAAKRVAAVGFGSLTR